MCGEQNVGGQAASKDPVRKPDSGPGERAWQPGPGLGGAAGWREVGTSGVSFGEHLSGPGLLGGGMRERRIANDPHPAEKQALTLPPLASAAPCGPPLPLWGRPPAHRAPGMRASQLVPIVVTPQGVMGTQSPCPLCPPLPRQAQALTMPLSQPVAWTQCPCFGSLPAPGGLLGFLACLAHT